MASRFMLAVFAVGSLTAYHAGTGPAQAEFPAELTERIGGRSFECLDGRIG